MSIVSKLAKTARTKIAAGSKVALKRGGDAFNRLDELGGDARDAIKIWWEESPAMGSAREMWRKRTNGEGEEPAFEDDDGIMDAEIVEPEAAIGLGDPSIGVQVFGARSCPWSGRAVRLLEDAEIDHQFIDLDDRENDGLSSALVAETKHNTVPYIFIRGEFVGGFNALDELYRLGQLEAKVSEISESRVNVEVAPRPSSDETAPAAGHHPDDAPE